MLHLEPIDSRAQKWLDRIHEVELQSVTKERLEEYLAEEVYGIASSRASDANRGGLEQQVVFLLRFMSDDHFKEALDCIMETLGFDDAYLLKEK